MQVLSTDYRKLYSLCRSLAAKYDREEFEDIFQDCILFASTDCRMQGLSDVKEIEDLFCYRFRMIEFSHYKKKQQRKEISYADYLQDKEGNEEAGGE